MVIDFFWGSSVLSKLRVPFPPLSRTLRNPPDFSLVLGGPLYQLLLKAHLSDDALMMVRQRVIIIALIAWVPLLVLSGLEGHLWRGDSGVSFLYDIEVHIRFLVAMPLLIVAELVVHNRLRPLLHQFGERDLIPAAEIPRFESAVAAAFRLRNSALAEVLLIAFVYTIGVVVVWRHYIALDTATWYATPSPDGIELTPAGWWYGYISLPIFQFLLCRWCFRLFIWSRFLWQVSRIPLRLNPVHPDRLGALGFLSNTVYAFAVIAVAHGVLLAGTLANRVFFADAALMQFKAQVAVVVALLLCIAGPAADVFAAACSGEARRLARIRRAVLSAMRASSTPNGCAVVHQPRSRSWGAPTSSRSRISPTVSKWCGRCASCRLPETPSSASWWRRWLPSRR